MAETEPAQETISPEAHKRVKTDNDNLKTQVKDLETQLEASRKVSGVESFLRKQGVSEEDIPSRMDLLAPHLTEIPVDQISNALADDRFKPLVAVPPVLEGKEDDEEEETPPVVETPPGGFGGPSPAGDSTPPEQKKFRISSPEVQDIIRRNDREALHKLYKDKRIEEPVRNY